MIGPICCLLPSAEMLPANRQELVLRSTGRFTLRAGE